MRAYFRLLLPLLIAASGPAARGQAPPVANAASWAAADTLPGIDFAGLSAAQKQTALELLRDQDCSCQCGMKVAECRFKDPNCSYSKNLAGIAIAGLKAGRSRAEIAQALGAAPGIRRPKLLEDPVAIPTAGAPVKGPADAKITVVEFSDFECPYCSQAVTQMRQIMLAYPHDVKLIYKQFPLPMHPHAGLAAAASLAAQAQGKFWEMHDMLFAHFRQLNRENILLWAREIGLDADKFAADLDSGRYQPAVRKDMTDGEAAGVNGTPAFFINGRHYNGPLALETVKPILDAELKGQPAAGGAPGAR